uniref:Flavin-containing amine oxidase n=1 Tax=Marseillevirus LCMAC101 TaxID=2506602 RepID=A0A481YSI9_9VIRU|nr:MAG: flavin-containing amine oxidase [Marseillevirus LCMAC101]
MKQKKKVSFVAVFGCGISGLAAAHELAEKGLNVRVYEKLLEPGGVARSYRPDSESVPSEYSWRGYGPFYFNAFDLMKRIPTMDGKTVYDNLSRPIHFIFTKNKGSFEGELSWKDKVALGIIVSKVAAAGVKRTAHYASINAADYMKPRMSDRGWKQFIHMFGPWVGIDPQRASLFHVIFFIVVHYFPNSQPPYWHHDKDGKWKVDTLDWSVFNKPTSDAWFDPWVKHLENMGVKFYFGHGLYSIQLDRNSNRISSVVVSTGTGNQSIVKADNYVMAISPFGMRDVLKESISSIKRPHSLIKMADQFSNLTQDGPHIQVSFRIGFDTQFSWADKQEPVILSDSEFNITMYSQDDLWDNNVYLGPGIKSLWSGTACVSYVPGSLFGKAVVDLTKDQFKQEILCQLSKDVGFNDMLREKMGKSFSRLLPNMIHFDIWKNWRFTDGIGKPKPISIIEPKYVDSTNTRPHQPHTATPISNMWMAGGHTRTSTDIWSMEAAAEAGRRAADMITGGNSTIVQDKGVVLKSLGIVDDMLYTMGMPNVVDVVLLLIIILIIILIIYVLRRRKNKK